MTAVKSTILGPSGEPYERTRPQQPRQDLSTARVVRRRDIHATYDAARDSADMRNYWANADSHDSDSANSKTVRRKLVQRSRYEVGNNGYADGMVQTHANYVVGLGPTLQMKTKQTGFNSVVEKAWKTWWKAVLGRRKLWCMCHAKVQDGEAFAVIKNNPGLNHPVELDLQLIETEQCTTPYMPVWKPGYIDGIHFDEFGNPITFDILPYHPGGPFAFQAWKPISYPARLVLHWFMLRRPGQNRAVPEFKSTLNVGATARRWREATVGAAEAAADYATIIQTTLPPGQEADAVAALTEVEYDKRMMTALPAGWTSSQMSAEHPNATYDTFHSAQVNEQARPKSIPQNIATCNSSGYNFASGKLDHGTYFLTTDIEREDCADTTLDPLFTVWFQRAALVYGWNADPREAPEHDWDWNQHPVADVQAESTSNNIDLHNGSKTLRQVFASRGLDYDDVLPQMAADYGKTPAEMQEVLLKNLFPVAFNEPQANRPGDNVPAADSTPADQGGK